MARAAAFEHPPGADAPAARRPEDCSVEHWLAFLGHRWNALLLWHLGDGPKRHGELKGRLPGVTPKVLTARLQELRGAGLVVREDIAGFPAGVVYRLTDAGRSLLSILDQIDLWARTAPCSAASAMPRSLFGATGSH
ncbi:helix-turn-helix transcriptional regulator [Schlegelella sp. S2-27]|uniref:Helix-turn-helix transcriptional regulator n=1 Tax=Caldimonas mangrovi TaxID=2944811 RepID=A0ABT0YN78_9BURK|nr:helix-turn-helix domain-containing protein [Caldimonas mangrovi]MCM5679621.1 helix-turn-helix transcriptional regulator [Caldimonas mangrovi]